MPRTLLAVLALFCVLLTGCGQGAAGPSIERGHDPWVFRSVLDWQPRMVTLALRDSFWVAYDTEHAALYKVWQDGVSFDGPVYTTSHGPQPVSLGKAAYLVSPYQQPWEVRRGGQGVPADVQYRGHRFENEQATLNYELRLGDGTMIRVTERPEYAHEGSRQGFERVFTTEGVPEGAEVVLQMHLHSLRAADSYETDGTFEAGLASEIAGSQAFTRDGRLLLNANGSTRFVAWLHDVPMVPVEAPRPDKDKPPGLALIERSDCHACHNPEVQTVGPAYVSIAERYDASPEHVTLLAKRIIEGSTGVWQEQVGNAIMTPHPNLSPEDAQTMVEYILSLGAAAAASSEAEEAPADPVVGETYAVVAADEAAADSQGIAVNLYRYARALGEMPRPTADEAPAFAGIVPALNANAEDFGGPLENFYLEATGSLLIPETDNYVFRLTSDDGAFLLIDGKVVIDNDGLHGPEPKDGELYLQEGAHPFTVRYFQSGGGLRLALQWIRHGEDEFSVIPPEAFRYDADDLKKAVPFDPASPPIVGTPGDGQPLIDVHPGFTLETVRPSSFEPMVGGMGFLSDGRMVVSTWDPDGSVYVLGKPDASGPESITVERIAKGLAEPLGLAVVDDAIYVLQKQELTHLIDHDGDEVIDEYRTVANGWGATPNFHEFAFGLIYEDGYFYATLATAIEPGGASTQPQHRDRGKVIRISKGDGTVDFVASGLRTPNGIGFGINGHIFVADNQGDWLPSSKIVHLREGAFYGNRSVAPEDTTEPTDPVVWLPQDEIGNSPSQPAALNVGPYQNQMVHGEVTHGGLKRVFAEEIDGQLQGAVFRFTQGLEAGVNRLILGPDGSLYIGGIGNPGNWGDYGKQWYGLQRLSYNGTPAFEMLAVRARTNGMEIEFTEPLTEGVGSEPDSFLVKQWWYEPTENYGGPKMDEQEMTVRSVEVSEDRKSVFLEVPGLKPGHVVYLRLASSLTSEPGRKLWSTEAWYTLNRIPENRLGPGFAQARASAQTEP